MPRDQELRYTVHDSPDYYQLKVSVFNDDKRTELIGETWIDLKDVVVAGGGQNDIWHNLSCKGKYAGEIRIEITYYDTRPKEERPAVIKQSGTNGTEEPTRDSLRGPRQPKSAVKRRPLPSDPVTGAASPIVVPDHVQTPPRGYPPSPTAAQDYPQASSRSLQYAPSSVSDHSQTPSRGYQQPSVAPDPMQTPPRGYQQQQQQVMPDQFQTPPRAYQNQPQSAVPEHVHTPQQGYQTPSYISNQSPLQKVEYNTPPQQYASSQGYENSPRTNGYDAPQAARPRTSGRNEPPSRYDVSPGNDRDRYVAQEQHPQDQYTYGQNPYSVSPGDEYGSPPDPDGPPPPPPAHRSGNSINTSAHVSPAPVMSHHNSYGFPADGRSIDPYQSPRAREETRKSIAAPPQSSPYQAYSPSKEQNQFRKSGNSVIEQPTSRHQSYDARYRGDYGSMQPSVEDVPESPAGVDVYGHRGSMTRVSPYEQVPSPAPLNLGGRGSSNSAQTSMSNTPSHQYSNSSIGYTANISQVSSRERALTDTPASSHVSYNPLPDQRSRGHSQGRSQPIAYAPPPVPPTLVPGMDPMIAQEISDRIYDEKRASYAQNGGNSTRGRYQNPVQYQPTQANIQAYHESSMMVPFVPASASSNAGYDDRQSYYSGDDRESRYAPSTDDRQRRHSNTMISAAKPRAVSPDPRAVARKSVSPAPPPSRGGDDTRRLSGVPFGPDSYNAFNPVITTSVSTPTLSAAYNPKDVDVDAKIITHDGREIDPSDHIPESNYAPLLEKKGPTYASQQPDRNYRALAGPQPLTNSGRRPLKQAAARPQSIANSSPIYMSGGLVDPATPTGRNRLQKKSNRISAQPAPQSSPLVPVTPYQDNNYAPRSLPRSQGMEYNSNENYAPPYGGSLGYRGQAGPPPVPAKVPMGRTGVMPIHAEAGGDPWALLEEMKNIDLGSGRARRRGY